MAAAVDWSSEGVELKHLEMAVAVDRSTETAAVASLQWSCSIWRRRRRWIGRQRRRQWRRCIRAEAPGDSTGGGSAYADGGSGVVAVVPMGSAVDRSTETTAVASLQCSSGIRRRRQCWIGRRRWWQWLRCSEAEAPGDGGVGGSVDRDGGSGVVALEPRHVATKTAAVDRSTETAAVASLQWS